jgi:predicted peptidase
MERISEKIYAWRLNEMFNLPVWIFHGALDDCVPLSDAERMANYMKHDGAAEVKYTVYPDLYHHIWEQTYANPELYEWFLRHQKQ